VAKLATLPQAKESQGLLSYPLGTLRVPSLDFSRHPFFFPRNSTGFFTPMSKKTRKPRAPKIQRYGVALSRGQCSGCDHWAIINADGLCAACRNTVTSRPIAGCLTAERFNGGH
jgi:hypothetical protein